MDNESSRATLEARLRKAGIFLSLIVSIYVGFFLVDTLLGGPPLLATGLNASFCALVTGHAYTQRRVVGWFWVLLPIVAMLLWLSLTVSGIFIDLTLPGGGAEQIGIVIPDRRGAD